MISIIKKFNNWFDGIKEPKRFKVFFFMIAMPFSVGLLTIMMYPKIPIQLSYIIFVPLIFTIFRILPKVAPILFK